MNLKAKNLEAYLIKMGRVAVALSGGLDSCVLLDFAVNVLGSDKCLALTAVSPNMIDSEIRLAEDFCRKLDVCCKKVDCSEVFHQIKKNPPERCYMCKRFIFGKLLKIANECGFENLCDGSNADDMSDFRPGMRAVKELGVCSPLLDTKWAKIDINAYAVMRNLSVANKPAYACLMTRFLPNVEITERMLMVVDSAEDFLRELGFMQVRVRIDGNNAKITFGASELKKFLDSREDIEPIIAKKFTELGLKITGIGEYKRGLTNV